MGPFRILKTLLLTLLANRQNIEVGPFCAVKNSIMKNNEKSHSNERKYHWSVMFDTLSLWPQESQPCHKKKSNLVTKVSLVLQYLNLDPLGLVL